MLTVKPTVYFLDLVYVCTGFGSIEVTPSPKFQSREVGDPVLVSVNATVSGAFPEVGVAEKPAMIVEFPPTKSVS